jgi:hypothetical protein
MNFDTILTFYNKFMTDVFVLFFICKLYSFLIIWYTSDGNLVWPGHVGVFTACNKYSEID